MIQFKKRKKRKRNRRVLSLFEIDRFSRCKSLVIKMRGPFAACFKLLPSATITNDVRGQTNLGFLFFFFSFFFFFSTRFIDSPETEIREPLVSDMGRFAHAANPVYRYPLYLWKGIHQPFIVRTCGPILPMVTDPVYRNRVSVSSKYTPYESASFLSQPFFKPCSNFSYGATTTTTTIIIMKFKFCFDVNFHISSKT